MEKQALQTLYNTLNQIEVKGYDNINRLFSVLMFLKQEMEKEVGENDGEKQ